eukprot:352158-Chlamydomonas_euryale.AAC.1
MALTPGAAGMRVGPLLSARESRSKIGQKWGLIPDGPHRTSPAIFVHHGSVHRDLKPGPSARRSAAHRTCREVQASHSAAGRRRRPRRPDDRIVAVAVAVAVAVTKAAAAAPTVVAAGATVASVCASDGRQRFWGPAGAAGPSCRLQSFMAGKRTAARD